MAIFPAVDVISFDADVFFKGAAVPPPFRRAEQADDGSAGRYRQVRGPSVATDENACVFRQRIKTFQGQAHSSRFIGLAVLQYGLCKFGFAWTIGYERVQTML